MTEFDDALRESFARLAEPGDPAGVADAIRSRIEAGDTGTPAQSSGFGGGGLAPWLFGGAVVVVAALGGGAIGASGLVGGPPADEIQLTMLAVDERTDAFDCPGGSPVSTFTANERALVVARTDDSAWLAVRDSYDYSRTVWLPASVVSIDADQGDIGAIAVAGCAEPIVVVNTPSPAPSATVDPQKPTADADTVAPIITSVSADPTVVYNSGPTVLHVTATDDVAVTSVTVVLSGDLSGSASLTKVGSEWRLKYTPPPGTDNGQVVTFTFTAKDAAGNKSSTKSVSVQYEYFG